MPLKLIGYYICNWTPQNGRGSVDLYENGGTLIDNLPVVSVEEISAYHTLLSSNNECTFDTNTGAIQIGQNASGQGLKTFQ
ncbi:MAG: hypothetical protein GY761_14245 [Hyphomicrobiales bacterium]|nr:hypothetical protein [Hyphomicrobiales bacterium]